MDEKKKAKKPGAKEAPAKKESSGLQVLKVQAWQTKAKRTVNTIDGPRVVLPGEWILDLTEGHYAVASDECAQRLLK